MLLCVVFRLLRNPADSSMMGTVGLPLPGVDMRLEAVPELGYLPSDPKAPKGEVRAALQHTVCLQQMAWAT
jgi:hypothetical protein